MADISGDRLKPGPDGHIRHPDDAALVWWEFADGVRHWVRQSVWDQRCDIKTERSHPEVFYNMGEAESKALRRRCREDGVRYKVRRRPMTDWNAAEGPWEAPVG